MVIAANADKVFGRLCEAMGRPGRLVVDVPVDGGIAVSGHAVPIPDPLPAGETR